MKLSDLKEPRTLYHVTHSHHVGKILANGIQPMQTSNWIKQATGERYGDGHVFAFEHPDDAVRWAGKMDYEFNKKIGSGKVSVIEFQPGEQHWEEDDADPLAQAGAKGRWLKSAEPVKREQLKSSQKVTTDMVRKATSR